MPNDAKLGLVLGIGAFIAVAVLFCHKDLAPDRTDRVPAGLARPGAGRPKAHPTSNSGRAGAQTASLRRHTVQEGDSLFALAEKYYGDGDRFIDLYLANKGVLRRPDQLPSGTVLVVPDLEEAAPEPRVAAVEPVKPVAPPATTAPPAAQPEPPREEPPKPEPAKESIAMPETFREEAVPLDRVTDRGGDEGGPKADAAALPPLPPLPGLAGTHP